jgi:Fe-S-cluster-containing hydrogenase component 2
MRTVSLNDFLKQELMQGQNLLLLDLERCTRCDECAKACVATHDDGVSRLIREGLRFDKYLVPTSCRACMDPLCMTRCPVGSIRRKDTLDIVIEDWCIGCSNCAVDCPYGNINIVPVSGFVQIEGTNMNAKQKAEMRPKATTCDLCVEYDEPNCVRACPHGAAMRVEPKTFFAHDLAGLQLAVATELPVGPAAFPAGEEQRKADETMVMMNVADLLPMLPRMRVRSGDRPGRVLQLRYPATTFGRGAEADYRFAEDTQMSRIHCAISADGERFILRDNESTNGTFVNGNRVTEIELRNGDVVQFGDYELDFVQGSK